jgi:salicylate hydroxylase/6-hydroxynicotinate 3-monooxygenase
MAKQKLSVAIIGAGMGGLTAAATLRRVGIDVQVYEQANTFARVGAGIRQSPNAMKVLRVPGLEAPLRRIAFEPRSWLNREWDSSAPTNEFPLGSSIEECFGAPYLLLHRGDLHAALASIVPGEII